MSKDDFKKTHNEYGVDRTLLVARLKLTPTERLEEHMRFMSFVEELKTAKIIKDHDKLQTTSSNPR
ncbi:hypothetical protein K1X76_03315 [bacterium]|nr:hypothetical protein [bacterium]